MRKTFKEYALIFVGAFFLLIFSPLQSFSTPVLQLETGKNRYSLGKYVEYLEDREGTLSINNILSPEVSEKFKQSTVENLNFGFSDSVYWVRFSVKNRGHKTTNWLLEIGYPHHDQIELYLPDEKNGYVVKKAGDRIPFREREILHRNFVFIFPAGEIPQTIYLKLKSEGSMQIPLTMWTPVVFSEKVNTEQFGFGLYYGIILVMIAYNLFLFMGIRDKIYLYYILFSSSFMVGQMSLNGLHSQFLWPNYPDWANASTLIGLFLSGFFTCQFCRAFLDTRQNVPKLDKILLFLMGMTMLGALTPSILRYSFLVKMVGGLGLLIPIPSIIAGIICLRKGVPAAKIYLLAWFCYMIGLFTLALRNFGLVPNSFFTEHAIQVGSVLEVVIFSIALVERVNTMKREKFLAQREALKVQEKLVENLRETEKLKDEMTISLEKKVEERTAKLNTANEDLKEAEEKASSLLENSPDIILNIDRDLKILYMNRTITGFNAEEVVGESVLRFIPETHYNSTKKAIQQAFETAVTEVLEIKIDISDKDALYFEVRLAGIKSDGLVSEVMLIASDITKRKQTEEKLDQAQKELIEKAHKAGMADIATDTIHNMGNLLNSIKVSTQMMETIIKKSQITSFQKANEVLRENMETIDAFVTSDPKGKKLLEYYLKIEEGIMEEHNLAQSHLSRLADRVNDIEEVIVAQQSYTGAGSLVGEYSFSELIDDALTMQSEAIGQHQIKVVKDYKTVPKVSIQKNKLINILFNLIKNAKEAMNETPEDSRILKLLTYYDEKAAYIAINDTGYGISEEDMKKIFVRGYSTKGNRQGFGLHSSANYMTEMDGEMWAESDGMSKGATFFLKFPFKGQMS